MITLVRAGLSRGREKRLLQLYSLVGRSFEVSISAIIYKQLCRVKFSQVLRNPPFEK